jgi:hypothetical protein
VSDCEKSSPKQGITGFLLFLGVIGVIFSGLSRTFLWEDVAYSAINPIIVLVTFLSIILFIVVFFYKDCLKNRL